MRMKSDYKFQNFGINNRKTIDEKYALLWEVLSDSQFQDVFIVDVLQKQNKGKLNYIKMKLCTDTLEL